MGGNRIEQEKGPEQVLWDYLRKPNTEIDTTSSLCPRSNAAFALELI